MSPSRMPPAVEEGLPNSGPTATTPPGDVAGLAPEALLEIYRPWLREMAAAELPESLRTRLDASDVVQDTLVEIARDLPDFAGTSRPELEAWMLQILRHQLLDEVKFHGRQRRSLRREVQGADFSRFASTVPTGSSLVRRREVRQQLGQLLEQLPEHYRTVILLRQQLDLTFAEIGERTGRTADAARMLWGRAILRLAELLPRD